VRLEGRVENSSDGDVVVRVGVGTAPHSFFVTLPESSLAASVGAVQAATAWPRSQDRAAANAANHWALRIVFIS
jgi:hypothetical protein